MVQNMKKIVILSLLATLLLAQAPQIYSALGDVIYGNVDKIKKLKNMYEYNSLNDKIEDYVVRVYAVKKTGLAIEAGDKTLDKTLYLEKLRRLSKTNDFFVREVYKSFRLSIAKEDSWFLSQIINSGDYLRSNLQILYNDIEISINKMQKYNSV